jgi:putative endonuclease
MTRKETGILGEKLARDFIKKRGYHIVETNYRCRYGEVDIVARYKEYLVFIEVRTKSNRSFGTPEESITAAKKVRMRRVTEYYYQSHERLPENWRIDLVAVELNESGKPGRIEVVENAV